MASEPLAWRDLSTVVRRSFDEWVTRFQDASPGSLLERVDVPYYDRDGGIVVPFRDARSGARYEATVSPDGAVSEARELA